MVRFAIIFLTAQTYLHNRFGFDPLDFSLFVILYASSFNRSRIFFYRIRKEYHRAYTKVSLRKLCLILTSASLNERLQTLAEIRNKTMIKWTNIFVYVMLILKDFF